MKKTAFASLCSLMILTACAQKNAQSDDVASLYTPVAASQSDAQPTLSIEGETCTYGNHTYTMTGSLTADEYRKDATGTVTFTNVPSDYAEFEAVYTQFLGRTPHGTAAMMPMAMELYRRDPEVGKRCLDLLCWKTAIAGITRQLKNKFQPVSQAPAGDSYAQPYLPAAVLKGATPQNAYTPTRPYTVEMRASVNRHRTLTLGGNGTMVYLYVIGCGWDATTRGVDVVRLNNSQLHQVFNCPALYTQCKVIEGDWPGLE